jgi:hypothetical protein
MNLIKTVKVMKRAIESSIEADYRAMQEPTAEFLRKEILIHWAMMCRPEKPLDEYDIVWIKSRIGFALRRLKTAPKAASKEP